MIFISHCRQDQTVAREIELALQLRGVTTWADFSRIPIGERFVEEISGALRQSTVFLLVSSALSARSYWVARELAYAARLRTLGIVGSVIRLDLDGTSESHQQAFDYTFSDTATMVEHVINNAIATDVVNDPHQVDIRYFHPRPPPRVWLGFSTELAVLDDWFLGSDTGLWISGLGGSGKSSLAQVWLSALRMMGYQHPLNVSVHQWDFYEARRIPETFDGIDSGILSSAQSMQLLFLDGMDELRESPKASIHNLLLRFPKIKFLVTSREQRPDEFASSFRSLRLQALDRTAAELLAARLGIANETTERLLNAAQGNPLTISFAASLIQRGADVEDLLGRLEAAPHQVKFGA